MVLRILIFVFLDHCFPESIPGGVTEDFLCGSPRHNHVH